MVKKDYLTPEVDVIHLTLEEAVLTGSQNATGADITFGTETGFDDIFIL